MHEHVSMWQAIVNSLGGKGGGVHQAIEVGTTCNTNKDPIISSPINFEDV